MITVHFKLSYTITAIVFIALLTGTAFMLTELKEEAQVYMLTLGFVTLASLYAKPPFITRIPFNIFLGILAYINIFILTMILVDIINPNDGIVRDSTGAPQHVMQMNWVWGVFAGIVLAPFIVSIYHYKAPRNKLLETMLASLFIVLVVVVMVFG